MSAGRVLPRGHRRCENCDGPVRKGFSHTKYNDPDRYNCKRVNWKRRALAAERALELLIAEEVDRRARLLRYESALREYAAQDIGGSARAALR